MNMKNITIYDNGSCFMVCVDGLMTCGFSSLSCWSVEPYCLDAQSSDTGVHSWNE